MANTLHLAPPAALRGQFALWCRTCGASAMLVRGFCQSCYVARRHDLLRFGGLRVRVLERDRHACRVCGGSKTAELRLHVHHRRPGISREKLLIALCPAHHAQVHRLRVLDRIVAPLLAELWREQHPGAAEQLVLDFMQPSGPKFAPAPSPVSLWEDSRAG